MKKLTIQLAIILCATSLFAQWIPVNNGLPDYPPTSLIAWVDTIVVSTYGGGIYLTYDNGENWSEMPGTLPNMFVNKIEYQGTQYDPIGVSTDGGPFVCVNGAYIDCNGTGLTNNSISWWSAGYGGIVKDAVAGTNGEGLFAADYTSPFIYDWSPANPGLSGDALFVNDGMVGEGIAIIATDGGIYKAEGNDTQWSAVNDGLIGDALFVKDIYWFGYTLLATHGGLYYTINMGDAWQPLIPDEKLNIVFMVNTDISPLGVIIYALGELGFYSMDFVNWIPIDFGGIEGEVTAALADSVNLFLGFTIDGKDGKESGGIYRKPVEQIITGIENYSASSVAVLHQNHPNPFSETTKITYTLNKAGFIKLMVYDILGNEIQTLVHESQQPGNHTYTFNKGNLKPGTYFYRLKFGNKELDTQKMVVLK